MKFLSLTTILLSLFVAHIPLRGQITSSLDGKLDRSFGENGKSAPGLFRSFFKDLQILPDGSIIGLHQHQDQSGRSVVVLSKQFANGTADESFGAFGFRVYEFATQTQGESIAVQPDGKFVIVGSAESPSNPQDMNYFVARLHTNGEIDQSFGTDGVVIKDFGTPGSTAISRDMASSIVLRPNGAMIVVGAVDRLVEGQPKTTSYAALVGLTQNGQVDASFGSNGTSMILSGNSDYNYYQLRPMFARQLASGKILVGENVQRERPAQSGEYWNRAILRRYHSNGMLDAEFASGGENDLSSASATPHSSNINNFVELSDGKIVILTSNELVRLIADGSYDGSFGNNGRQSLIDRPCLYYELALVNEGRIVVSKTCSLAVPLRLIAVIERRWPDGSLDIGFGKNGEFTADSGNMDLSARRIRSFQDRYLFLSGDSGLPGFSHSFTFKVFGRRKP